MNPNINPNENNVMYQYPTPPPAPKKKKMTPLKWVAIFVPLGIILLVLIGFLMIKGLINTVNETLEQIAETEQYELALDYLTESDIFREFETQDTTAKLTGCNYERSAGGNKKYEFTFKTEKATYVITVRDNGNGLYVSEKECTYYQGFADISYLTPVCL